MSLHLSAVVVDYLGRGGRRLRVAAPLCLACLLIPATARAQVAIQDGTPLSVTYAAGNSLSKPFTVTAGASVLVVAIEDKGANLTEPATLAWNGQTLTRDVQTSYTTGVKRSLALYHLFNPTAGTATITGTLGTDVSDHWVTAYTLRGVDTTVNPLVGSANTGGSTAGVTGLSFNISGVTAGSWAAVSSQFANIGAVSITGTGGTGTTVTDVSHATTAATAGHVAGLGGGTVTLSSVFVPDGTGPQKSNLAAVVFAPLPRVFGIKFLGNTTDTVTLPAGVIPMSGWNNIANGSFTSGNILSSDGLTTATLALSGSGSDNTWKSGAYPDDGDFSLIYGYQDGGKNAPATNVIGGLTGAAYDVYLYTAGEAPRPNSATDWLPNYTVNGTIYYTATRDARSAMWNLVKGTTVSQNSSTYPSTLPAGHYIKIESVAPVAGKITIAANLDNQTFRSPLNAIQLVQRGSAPQILTQPLDHRLYTGGVAELNIQAQGAGTHTYRWRRNGVELADGGRISGALTNSLTITNLAVGDTGDYDVVVTNAYGAAPSKAAHLDAVVMSQADAAFEAWIAAYKVVDDRGATFIAESLVDRYWAWAWQQAFMHWSVTDAYNRSQSPDHKRLIYALQNTFLKQEGNTLTWQDWNDDIQWEVIALIKGYQITGNRVALKTSISAWNAVMDRAWDDTFGGGVWEKMPKDNSKCALSNYPQIIGGMELYKVTGDPSYLTKCEMIYNWSRQNLFICTPAQAVDGLLIGQVIEGIAFADDVALTGQKQLKSNNVYNSGLLVQAACALYEATGNALYLNDAILAANFMVNRQPIMDVNNVNNGYFGAEQLVRGVSRLANLNQNNLWPTYGPWLQANCTAAWAMRRTDYNITRNRWTSATPTGIDLKALETHSGFLVQQVTPAVIPTGFVITSNPLTGTIIGTAGSFQNSGNGREKVFDGDVNTYFDSPNSNGSWAGVDLGADNARMVTGLRYYPRTSWSARMVGGVFQGANQLNFSDAVTLHTVATSPPQGVYQEVNVIVKQSFRYLRYLSPNGSWGNIAEVQFYGAGLPVQQLPAPPLALAPASLSASRNAASAVIGWPSAAFAKAYRLKRSTIAGGPYQVVADNLTGTSHADAVASEGTRYFYVVSSISDSSVESANSPEVEAVDAYRSWAAGSGLVPGAAKSAFNSDSDGDGIQNGVEYAVPAGLKIRPPVDSKVEFAADVKADDLVSVVVEESTDLVTWKPLPAMTVTAAADVAAGFRRMSLSKAVGSNEKQTFYRIKVAR